MDKSQINVALGYLSVLLGYLCLGFGPIRQKFGSMHSEGTIEPLLSSIREFRDVHKAAEYGNEMDVDGDSSNFAVQLQTLVDNLERSY